MSIARTSELSPEAYGILDECYCGPEPFFVLVSSVDVDDPSALGSFERTLVDLVNANLLSANRGTEQIASLSLNDIRAYIEDRVKSGEDLDEPPSVREEFSFATTDAGLALLKPEDRPIETRE